MVEAGGNLTIRIQEALINALSNAVNIIIQDLSVNKAKNNGIKLKNTKGVILRR